MVIEILILAYHKQSFRIIMEIDFFNFVGSRILSQLGENRLL